ncbi:sensor histidine kinase [Thalassiella azotivora]
MSRWGLQGRFTAAVAVVTVLTLTCLAVATGVFLGVRSQQHEVVDNYFEAITTSQEKFVARLEAHAAVHSYATTGDAQALEALEVLETLPSTDERLLELLATDEASTAALREAMAVGERWWTEWAQPTLEAARAGGSTAVDEQDLRDGDAAFERFDRSFDAYVGTLAEQRRLAVDELDRRSTLLYLTVLALAAVAVVSIALLWQLVRRWVVVPVGELAAGTRVVRDGDLDHPVHVSGAPEIRQLSHDVDEMRHRLVAQLATVREATEQLQQTHAALREQTEELERSNRELEQFAYVASHDLQEPLRKVASFCQLLEKRYGGQFDERGEQYIHFAVDGAKRMQQLINDLLDFSRVGRLSTGLSDVPLQDCLDRALGNLETALEESGAVVTHDELPVVHGEAPLLTQMLQNLVGNAVKFRGEEAPRVHVGCHETAEGWELSVADNGIGIEPQYHDRVFVIFQRLHPKDVYSGTGIGLSMCKKIVEHHGGRIWVDPDVERGTTIRWTLPRPAAAEPTLVGVLDVPVPDGDAARVDAGRG